MTDFLYSHFSKRPADCTICHIRDTKFHNTARYLHTANFLFTRRPSYIRPHAATPCPRSRTKCAHSHTEDTGTARRRYPVHIVPRGAHGRTGGRRTAITRTDFTFEGQRGKYTGKVRDVYDIDDRYLVMVVTDRISAFDVVLPEGIPYKGQVLNQIAAKFLDATADILPNWKIAVPDPMVTVGRKCEPFKVEMVIRGYLSGHAWREYKAGKRTICGVAMPEGMVENQKFPEPIITPTSKAAEGHDEDISKEEIIAAGLVGREEYEQLERYTRAIYARGCEIAAKMGLILVDTKYEFGKSDGTIYLMDEIHTPDSSRYFYAEGYAERLARGERQRQLSKEFVREWLMANGFQGQAGQKVPEMTPEIVAGITDRYIELYENITGERFIKGAEAADTQTILHRIETNVSECLKALE